MKQKSVLPAMGSIYDAGHRGENGAVSILRPLEIVIPPRASGIRFSSYAKVSS